MMDSRSPGQWEADRHSETVRQSRCSQTIRRSKATVRPHGRWEARLSATTARLNTWGLTFRTMMTDWEISMWKSKRSSRSRKNSVLRCSSRSRCSSACRMDPWRPTQAPGSFQRPVSWRQTRPILTSQIHREPEQPYVIWMKQSPYAWRIREHIPIYDILRLQTDIILRNRSRRNRMKGQPASVLSWRKAFSMITRKSSEWSHWSSYLSWDIAKRLSRRIMRMSGRRCSLPAVWKKQRASVWVIITYIIRTQANTWQGIRYQGMQSVKKPAVPQASYGQWAEMMTISGQSPVCLTEKNLIYR